MRIEKGFHTPWASTNLIIWCNQKQELCSPCKIPPVQPRHDEARASRSKQYSLIAGKYLKGELTLEILDLLGGELRGEAAGGRLVVVEHCVPGLLLAAKPRGGGINSSENPPRSQKIK